MLITSFYGLLVVLASIAVAVAGLLLTQRFKDTIELRRDEAARDGVVIGWTPEEHMRFKRRMMFGRWGVARDKDRA